MVHRRRVLAIVTTRRERKDFVPKCPFAVLTDPMFGAGLREVSRRVEALVLDVFAAEPRLTGATLRRPLGSSTH